MLRGLGRTVRYARSWTKGSEVVVHETEIERDGRRIPASFVVPAGQHGPLPGWIVLGGVTRMGRFHPQLVRFASALAHSGAAVLVPEIPEWRDLELAPGVTAPTVRASLPVLLGRPEVRSGKVGLVGFCFGAPQAAIAATMDDLADHIAGLVLFGSYLDLERTLRCQLTGVHEWQGVRERVSPDPFGRWVLASNYLTHVPGCADAGDVAGALHRLAAAASELRIPAWDPRHDDLKLELRGAIAPERQGLFDMFAPLTTAPAPPLAECEEMAAALASACRRVEPLLDPLEHLPRLRVPLRLMHGRGDRLIPYTESLRLHAALPPKVPAHVTVSGLFHHTADRRPETLRARVWEGAVFLRALQGILLTV